MATNTSLTVVKLNNENYQLWKFKIEMLLIKEDLWTVINDDVPTTLTDAWTKKDNQARATICLLVEDNQIENIREQKTAKDIWNKLKTIHERDNLTSKLYLLRKLYSIKYKEGTPMQEHITKILEIVSKLRAVKEEIKDTHIGALILCSLPNSYESLITALEAWPEKELSLELIKNKVLDEANRRSERKQNQNSDEAIAFKTSRNRNKYCTYCRRNNHETSECRFKKKNELNFEQSSNYRNQKQPPFRKNFTARTILKEEAGRETDLRMLIDDVSASREEKNRRAKADSSSDDVIPRREQVSEEMEDSRRRSTKHEEEWKDRPSLSADAVDNVKENNNIEFSLITNVNKARKSSSGIEFIIDSGASCHIANDIDFFTELFDNNDCITTACGKKIFAEGIGKGYINCKLKSGITNKLEIKDCLYVPSIESNLLSVQKIISKGYKVNFTEKDCHITQGTKVVAFATKDEDGLYRISAKENNVVNLATQCKNENCATLWHRRLGHRDNAAINMMYNNGLVRGLKLDDCHKNNSFCKSCIKGKMSQTKFPKKSLHQSKHILDLIHSDICGPMEKATPSGKRYYITFIDDYSKYCHTYLLNSKDEAAEKFMEFVAMVQNKFNKTPKILRTDNGGEYIYHELENYLKKHGIEHQTTVRYTPSQNGTSERKNRYLVEMMKTMLNDARLDNKYWGETVLTATYLQNRLPTRSTQKTPFELWHGFLPYIGHLKVFGAKAFSYIPKQLRRKLDCNAEEGILIGYSTTTKGYRILNPLTEKVTISRSVKFDERNQLYHEDIPTSISDEENEINIPLNSQTTESEQEPVLRRSQRISRPPNRLAYAAKVEISNAPDSWEEVLRLENSVKSKWIAAADDEYKSLIENKTWTLVDLPKGKKAIGSKWVFKEKLLPDGTVTEKARLCALGYSQRPGVDFDETFSPVTKHSTIRAALKIAAIQKMHIKHLDIKTAFLYGTLEDEIFMKQPQGYEEPGQEDKVCFLQRSIYGLKQSSRIWNKTVVTTFTDMGFKQGDGDSCCFTKKEDDCLTIILLYVDDVLLISDSEDIIEEVKSKLQSLYTTKDLGNPTHYVGLQIERIEDGSFYIHQTSKIKQLIQRYNEYDERKQTYTPMSADYSKQIASDSELLSPEKKRNSREII